MRNINLSLLLSGFLIFIFSPVAAQQREYHDNNMFWSEVNIIGNIKGKFGYQLDYQHRRQAIPENLPDHHHNPVKHPMLQTIRPWLHYQYNPAVRFSFAPLAWLGHWRLPEDGESVFFPEFRITPQITLRQPIGRVIIQHRFRYEFRFIGRDHVDGETDLEEAYTFDKSRRRGRMRYMLKAEVPINTPEMADGTFYVAAFNEAMLNTGKNVPSNHLFDQNRTYAGVGYRFSKFVRVEAGYLKHLAFRLNNATANNVDNNNLIHAFLYFENFSELFSRKEK
ncbi:DUF2490 domain-containing protein [Adhaeribacter rhizoryzae]|uniref:DUF2490 domain-containing protein n=1 Tax=Adhaeribacter rhizoryzae TaxID=2607907 RepID=A0A5M6CX90_9BACT|nr:DUF2490 domain-containing protein [Adhaeribacter rhizoryzae]KAA5539546.1 DUF2490 domain-containing protein [Adhaeribacter rhizoryzae]